MYNKSEEFRQELTDKAKEYLTKNNIKYHRTEWRDILDFFLVPLLNEEELTYWLDHEAGVLDKICHNAYEQGRFQLEQNPKEYAQLLIKLKGQCSRLLEIGVGNGGCSFVNSAIISPIRHVCVDNCNDATRLSNINKRIELIHRLGRDIQFVNKTSDEFFKDNTEEFDLIIIDGDHAYATVKRDYENSLKVLRHYGIIAFHDVGSKFCPGVKQLWNEIKDRHRKIEFIHTKTCGWGIIEK